MTTAYSRRWLLTSGAALLGTAACAEAPERSLRPSARRGAGVYRKEKPGDSLVQDANLSGVVGYAVVDLRSGRVLEERASAAILPPASVAKSITALYALDTLGPNHRFTTRVLATGGVSNGVVTGDLVLAGGGDPALDTEQLALLAKRLKDAGIREVRGRFLVWGGALPQINRIDGDQPDHVGYNPSISGLNLNFNRVHFEWRRSNGSWRTTMDARSKNHRPDVQMARIKIASRSVPVYEYRDAGSHDAWTVASGALGKGGARWLPVRKPELYAGEVFATFARARGIALKSPKVISALPAATEITRVDSAPLAELIRDMLKFSTNLTAEVLGLAATSKRAGAPVSLRASAKAMTSWARSRLGMNSGTSFVDHSGLGDRSRISAGDMARALSVTAQKLPIRDLLKDIPMRDDKRKIIRNHPVKVRAKTGTLNFVSSLAGYMTAEDGRELAFAIFAADTRRRASIPRADRERPSGARSYNAAAKNLQQKLLRRWGRLYGAT